MSDANDFSFEAFAIGARRWPGISKLIEECGEVVQICGKILGAGGAANHWDGSNLRERLHEEIADLRAALAFVVAANELDDLVIERRTREKIVQFTRWHVYPEPPPEDG